MSFVSPFRAWVVVALGALVALLVIPSAHASQDIFLKLSEPELQGEVVDKTLNGAISVSEFEWELENPVSLGSASGGAGAGKAKLHPLKIKKLVDASSPGLMMAAAKGTAIPSASLSIRAAAGKPDAYLQYRLKLVVVADIQTSAAAGDDGVTETITLHYGSLQQRYVHAKPSGLSNPFVVGWDQVLNRPLAVGWE